MVDDENDTGKITTRGKILAKNQSFVLNKPQTEWMNETSAPLKWAAAGGRI